MQYRFNDNNGPIYNQTKIQGAKAHQVTTDAKYIHEDDREEHG